MTTARSGPSHRRLEPACLAAILFLGVIGALAASARDTRAQPAPSGASLAGLSAGLESLTDRVIPAVVEVLVARFGPSSYGGLDVTRQRSAGAGVIVDPGGYVITNAHVVAGARRVQVLLGAPPDLPHGARSILKTTGKPLGAQIVGIDIETDLAILKVEHEDLPYLELADSDKLRPGQLVLAFGSPLGLRNSARIGVVSSVARQLGPEDPMIYIQTDAAINPGDSGGPLVDTEGRVVGINTMIYTQSGGNEGLGFAAPSNIVRNVFEQLRETGRVRRGEIGIHAQTITPSMAAGLDLSQTWGVILGDVYPGSPAALAGLRAGDVVLALDGKIMENGRQLDVNIYGRTAGQRVNLEVVRSGTRRTFEVPVTERNDRHASLVELVTPERNLIAELGIMGVALDERLRGLLGATRKARGVVVAGLTPAAPTDGLLPADVIYAVNGRDVVSMEGLRNALRESAADVPVVLHVERRNQLMFVVVERR